MLQNLICCKLIIEQFDVVCSYVKYKCTCSTLLYKQQQQQSGFINQIAIKWI